MTTARDVYLHLLATNPRFRLAPKRGEAVVIVWARTANNILQNASQKGGPAEIKNDDGELT